MDKPLAPKKVVLLGSTGSIGQSTIKVAEALPDHIEIVGLAANQNTTLLSEQLHLTGAKKVSISNESKLDELTSQTADDVTIYSGENGLVDLVQDSGADMLLVAIVGVAGLKPTLAAIDCGMDLAIASKEILVMAGEIVMKSAKEKNVSVLPVDSEHNAIYQCLEGQSSEQVSKLILTASGGPFRKTPKEHFANVTPEEALAHPTWDMGKKISIDSATLFNKGLEMIEARWLFDVPMDQIDVVVHPQSIVHSMIEMVDGSILAQLSHSDMCFPIQYALTWPTRIPNTLPSLNFGEIARLEFEAPRYDDFPSLNLARKAGNLGGVYPAVYNASNEVLVEAFLSEKITFPTIWETVDTILEETPDTYVTNIESLIEIDQWAREKTHTLITQIGYS